MRDAQSYKIRIMVELEAQTRTMEQILGGFSRGQGIFLVKVCAAANGNLVALS